MPTSPPDASDQPMRATIEYDNGKTLMAQGPQALHDHVASRMEKALGRALPQMEVRFKDVSISADIVVKDETDLKTELPTLANELMKSVREMRSSKHVVKKQVLQNVSGVFKPGTTTLVLGQPGSGKSSLMKLLSGRFPSDKNVTIEGDVTYNGIPSNTMPKRLPQFVSYVNQRDKHYPSLTVKETLEFAHACCGGGFSEREAQHLAGGTPEENKAALDAARAMFKHYPDIVIQQLGLDNCQNTIVGDAMTRGVSGGERKRVTTGEMEFGNKFVMMMDEISTGLDSAATFDIITTQRSIAKKFRKTVVISLLQPSPEVFELFDDVVILNEGHVMYHGPRAEVLGYFEGLGFKCPPRRDVADFLLDLGTDKQAQYEVSSISSGSVPRSASQYADVFTRSRIYARMMDELHGPVSSNLLEDNEKHMLAVPEFHQNFWDSTRAVVQRQITLTMRDTAFIIGRSVMVILMGLLYSSTFYQFDEANAQLVMGIIFNAVMFVSLGQQAQIPTFIAAREVFYKQRRANFFRTMSFVLSNSISLLPLGLAESLMFGSIVYWMCGYVATVEAFLLFELIMFMTNLAMSAWFFFLSCASPDLNVANPISMVSVLFFVLFAGFTITKEQIPDYLIWIYWIDPMAWGVRALAVNQYTDSSFDTCVYNDVDYCATYNMTMGEYSLTTFEVPTEKFWIWYGMVFMAAAYVFFMFLSYIALEYHRYESPENVTLDSENKGDASEDYGLMRTPRGSTNETEAVLTVTPDSEKHFIPVTVAFKDLWYTVPDPTNPKDTIDLLKGISGYALPGTITALMGSSGAGKTTLMDVIAGRKTGGTIRGQILLNGHPATDLAIRRSTGYCEQMDIHSESATIREALTFSAFLRQGADVPDSYKYDSVNECLDLLNLHPIADQIIRGSSVEQMKRLTIGVELAAQPSVLFLDEPTSGLDARSAKLIMDGVRKVANTGRTVVCTIHQPSTEVFSVFDSLLLLKRGGETVFAGELGKNASEMIAYFESIDGVAKLEDNYNPATWMLEVIGAGVGNSNGDKTDFVKTFQESKHFQFLKSNLDREGVSRPSPSLPALEFSDKRAATELTQTKFLMQRFFNMYWRTASYNLTRFSLALILGVIFGVTYATAEYSSYAGINSGMGMLFCATGFIGFVAFTSVIPVATEDRLAFYRERAAQTYNALWYFVASTVIEIPYVFFSTLLFMAPYYPSVGFTGVSTFFAYWLHLSMHVLWQVYFGQLMSYLMPTVEVAAVFGVLLQMIFFLFTGFNPPGSAIPTGYKWLYHITPHKYSLALIASLVFGDCPSDGDGSEIGCQVMTGVPPSLSENMTVKEYMEDVFLMKHSEIWKNFGFVLGFIVLFRLLGLLALRFVNHQKK
ncbi:ABC transporter G family member 34 [Phytophthora rubi]|uniref:ABC transporter G family member 34 n=1 Tax=Phytophthora rubi TaxID=129364 RepID=A0A6A3LU85_9STRA|nr:ABC transporter G family member 34 [Phytophthora rubi]